MQFPAPGPFNHLQLEWTEKVHAGPGKPVKCQAAGVPSIRVSDFMHGEEELHDCKWISSNVIRQTLEDLRGKRITSQTALSREHWHCHVGPEDHRRTAEQLANPPPKRPGGRRSKRAKGKSIKRGCQAHFRVVEYADRPGISEITYYRTQHVDRNGQPCHETGTSNAARKRKYSSVKLPAIGDSSSTAVDQTCDEGSAPISAPSD